MEIDRETEKLKETEKEKEGEREIGSVKVYPTFFKLTYIGMVVFMSFILSTTLFLKTNLLTE